MFDDAQPTELMQVAPKDIPSEDVPEPMILANTSMQLSADGRSGIVRFNLFGAVEIATVIPEAVITEFVTQWFKANQNTQALRNVLRQSQDGRSKLYDTRGHRLQKLI